MKKQIYVLLTLALFAASSAVLNAEDNIQFSDEYFEINSGENQNSASQPGGIKKVDAGDAGKKDMLYIAPAPAWTLKRELEKELIEEISFNENSPDGIISQEGMAPAESIRASGNPSPVRLAKQNADKKSGGALPKTPDPEIETILGDWVFDFPK